MKYTYTYDVGFTRMIDNRIGYRDRVMPVFFASLPQLIAMIAFCVGDSLFD
jgi:hypothetical protein